MSSEEIKIKSVVVGDGYVGKTCMIMRYLVNVLFSNILSCSYCQDSFPQDHIPTVFDNYIATLEIEQQPIKLAIWYGNLTLNNIRDTAGQDDYERLRTLSYTLTDVFLVCFSLVDQESFKNALNKVRRLVLKIFQWIPELFQNAPNAPIVLVGTKLDLKQEYEKIPDKRSKVVPQSEVSKDYLIPIQGIKAVQTHNLFNYVECSAKTQENLNKVYSDAIRSVFKYRELLANKKRKKQRSCNIL